MKKKTFDFDKMNVQSFVTSFDTENGETVELKGGCPYPPYTTPYDGCNDWTKPADLCTDCRP
ncbi:MAG: pinensin family lanthipeptide [Cyclobacteriaceae bacterium]